MERPVLSKEIAVKKKEPSGNFRTGKNNNWNKIFTGLAQGQNGDDRGVSQWTWK